MSVMANVNFMKCGEMCNVVKSFTRIGDFRVSSRAELFRECHDAIATCSHVRQLIIVCLYIHKYQNMYIHKPYTDIYICLNEHNIPADAYAYRHALPRTHTDTYSCTHPQTHTPVNATPPPSPRVLITDEFRGSRRVGGDRFRPSDRPPGNGGAFGIDRI